jgi:hypothetical protein
MSIKERLKGCKDSIVKFIYFLALWGVCSDIVKFLISGYAIFTMCIAIGVGQASDGKLYSPVTGDYIVTSVMESVNTNLVIPQIDSPIVRGLVTFIFNYVLILIKFMMVFVQPGYWVGWHMFHLIGYEMSFHALDVLAYGILPLGVALSYFSIALPYYLVYGDVLLLKQMVWIKEKVINKMVKK